jgi:hypothetical protein
VRFPSFKSRLLPHCRLHIAHVSERDGTPVRPRGPGNHTRRRPGKHGCPTQHQETRRQLPLHFASGGLAHTRDITMVFLGYLETTQCLLCRSCYFLVSSATHLGEDTDLLSAGPAGSMKQFCSIFIIIVSSYSPSLISSWRQPSELASDLASSR